jgi:hypothetical protein
MRRRFVVAALLLALAAVSAGAVAASSGGGASGPSAEAARKPLRFEQHDLYIEYNATDGDAGLQLAADAEDWKRFNLPPTATGDRQPGRSRAEHVPLEPGTETGGEVLAAREERQPDDHGAPLVQNEVAASCPAHSTCAGYGESRLSRRHIRAGVTALATKDCRLKGPVGRRSQSREGPALRARREPRRRSH